MMDGSCFARRDACASAAVMPMWDTLQSRNVWTLYNPARTANKQSFWFAQFDAGIPASGKVLGSDL